MPFSIDAVYYPDQLEELCIGTTLAWPSVYRTHASWANDPSKRKLTLVIRGTLGFYKHLAMHCWPLGRLGNNNAFELHPENLQIFTRILSHMAGTDILFLYGGTAAVSDLAQVTAALKTSCLRNSPAYCDGTFKISIYDDVFQSQGRKIAQHFGSNPTEDRYLAWVDEFTARGNEDYNPDEVEKDQSDLGEEEGGEEELEENKFDKDKDGNDDGDNDKDNDGNKM